MPSLWCFMAWLQILKAHIWRNLWSQPPPANRHSHHPTTHRGALLDGERLTVPASSSRLSELELRSWEKEEGGREGGGSYSARAGEGGGGGENKTKTHLKVTLVPSVWAAGPGHDSAGLKHLLCHIYLWLLMWLGLISEPLWSNPCKAPPLVVRTSWRITGGTHTYTHPSDKATAYGWISFIIYILT